MSPTDADHSQGDGALVVEGGCLVGIVTASDVLRLLPEQRP